MSNGISQNISISHLWRGKSPGSNEFNNLLNLLPSPALVTDPRSNQILAANSEFLKLTAYSLSDLTKTELSALFPDMNRYELILAGEQSASLVRHSRDSIQVITKSSALDQSSNRVLLTITPHESYIKQKNETQQLDLLLTTVESIFCLTSVSDIQTAVASALNICQKLVSANILCVYQFDSKLSQFSKITSTENPTIPIFPSAVSENTVLDDSGFDLWAPGKRVVSDFHRIARVANLPYTAMFPLIMDGTRLGLFVIADTEKQPDEALESFGSIMSAGLAAVIYHFVLVQNLNLSLNQHIQSLSVRDTVMDNAVEGIILVRNDLTIEEMNPAAEFLLGYASREVVGVPVENILIGPDSLVPALQNALNGVPTHNLGNISLHRRSGQSFLSHLQTIPVMLEDGLLSIIVLLRDESENEQIRVNTQQLEQRAVLGEVTAIFAHEVRNPLNNISTGLQLLAMKFPGDDPNQDLLQRMLHDCSRLTHLMESVLTFSKPMEYKFVPSDLAGMFRRMLDRWRPRFAKANVEAFLQVEQDVDFIIGDLRALEQVFTNLLNNSIQAMTSGGVLAIKLTSKPSPVDSPEVLITISDTGPGIPDEIKEHIFEPFVTNNPQGTGLGLAITKRIITAHKGTIHVTSFPGGTVFHVTLPGYHNIGGK